MHGNQWIVRDEAFANMMNIKGIPHFLLYGKDGKLMVYKAPRPSHPAWQEELRTL
jgi:thioredoxin-related protein